MNLQTDERECSSKCVHETDEHKYEKIDQIIDSYKNQEGNLIKILHMAQDIFGYIPAEVQEYIAEKLNTPVSKIYGIVTFYTSFTMEPRGRHTIKVCDGTACHVKRSEGILDMLEKNYSLDKYRKTTPDKFLTLELVACLGACGLAPVVVIDEKVHGLMTPEHTRELLENIMKEELANG